MRFLAPNGRQPKSMFKRLLKYFLSASFIGIIIGLVGLYYELRERQTHLTVDVTAETNVLDIVHPIPDLTILFQGHDIEKQRANLKVLSIRLVNDGQTNIHEDDFDSRMPFGLRIEGVVVVRAQVTGASSSYLGENLRPQLSGQNQIAFDKIIFDKGSSVTVEALVIHNKEQQPRVTALGKIAGLERIAITNSFQGHDQQSFWGEVFQGPPAVQIVRLISYAFGGLVSVIANGFLIFGVVSTTSRWQKWGRRRKVARHLQTDDPEKTRMRKVIEEIYIEHGLKSVRQALDFGHT